MLAGSFGDILQHDGFREIGSLQFRMRLSLWWHDQHRLQILLCPIGSRALLKGSKSYFMKSISEDGETYARDIPQLHQYLEAHFDEIRIAFSHFRDVSKSAARHHLKKKVRTETPTIDIPAPEDLARIQHELAQVKQDAHSLGAFRQLDTHGSDLLRSYVSTAISDRQRRARDLKDDARQTRERLEIFEHLQRGYERNGSAATFSFSISSNVQLATSPAEFRDGLNSVVKELIDLHRYQITQKLNGGRLNIHIDEAQSPEIVWIEEWMGGALAPREIERLTAEFATLKATASERLMVTPKDDIRINGQIKEPRKLLGAHIASSLLQRLDDAHQQSNRDVPQEARPLCLGRLLQGDHLTKDCFLLPLGEAKHIYVSGTTGCGKSYIGRVIVEEAAQYDDLSILVLDPRNQWAGILTPEDRDSILTLYDEFDLDRQDARGFGFEYSCPGLSIGANLPKNLGHLASGKYIISFKGMDDRQRCALFADTLDAAFEAITASESETPRLLIVVEEAHRFTRKRVDESAKAEAARAEITLDRVVREGRKFGCCVVILSQTIRDFTYDAASIRQNTNTKVFMHNSDREVDYAAGFLGNGKQIIQLPPATAMIHNPAWGVSKVRVRPPFSKVWEFSPDETARLLDDPVRPAMVVTETARSLLAVIEGVHQGRGVGPKVGELGELAGISSKRRMQELLKELQDARLIRSTYLCERGKPRIVEPIPSTVSDAMADESRTEPDGEVRNR